MAATDSAVRIDRRVLKALAQPAPARLCLQVLFEWACVAALIAVALHTTSIAAQALLMLLVATRQHALLALMHEFAHHQFSRRHPTLNDVLGDVFTAFPFFITVHGFRRNHLAHHRHVATVDDPNWVAAMRKRRYRFPKRRRELWLEVARHVCGLRTLAELKSYTVDARMSVELPPQVLARQVFFFGAVIGLCAWLDAWRALLFWLLPLSTFLMAILYVRDIGEHYGMPAPGLERSRTVLCGWWERLLIGQNSVGYHAEHHLFPSVPFFRLPRLHRHLRSDPAYAQQAVIVRGYAAGLFRQVTQAPAGPAS